MIGFGTSFLSPAVKQTNKQQTEIQYYWLSSLDEIHLIAEFLVSSYIMTVVIYLNAFQCIAMANLGSWWKLLGLPSSPCIETYREWSVMSSPPSKPQEWGWEAKELSLKIISLNHYMSANFSRIKIHKWGENEYLKCFPIENVPKFLSLKENSILLFFSPI